MRYRLSRTARRELDGILAYWTERAGQAIAESIVDSIIDRFPLVRDFPEAGRACGDFAPGLRCLPAGDYLIYYKKTRAIVSILHILHGARNQKRALRRPKSR